MSQRASERFGNGYSTNIVGKRYKDKMEPRRFAPSTLFHSFCLKYIARSAAESKPDINHLWQEVAEGGGSIASNYGTD